MGPSHKDEKEISCLMASVNNCYNKGWVTEDEMLNIEYIPELSNKKLAIYELMRNKDEEIALNLFYDLLRADCKTGKTSGEKGTDLLQKNNPMELGPIIKCVFDYLDIKEIKSCRYVCSEWNRAAKSVLRTRSKVIIRQDNLESKFRPTDCINSKFVQIFSETPSLTDLPFRAFKIESGKLWLYAELNDFFQRQHTIIRELELGNINLGYSYEGSVPELENFDITRWIAESQISKPNAKYNSKLAVSSDSESVMFTMNSYNLVWVKDLSLKGCRLNLQEGIRISPIKLILSNVKFYWDSNRLQDVTVNDFLNFERLKEMELTGSFLSASKLVLDVSAAPKLKLESLTLNAVIVTGLEKSTWTVDNLIMSQTPLVEKMGMNVNKLQFRYSTISICSLPESLTTLYIHEIGIRTKLNFPTKSVELPHLKFMYLELSNNFDDSFLLYFVNCPSLVSMHLVKQGRQEKALLDLYGIPRNVKNLKLKGITISYQDNNIDLDLDNLILDEYTIYEAANVHHLRSKNLVLNWIPKFDTNYKLFQFLENLIDEYDMYNVAVGPFRWRNFPLKNSSLSNYLDRESQYYIFDDLKGRAIDRSQFDKLMEIGDFF